MPEMIWKEFLAAHYRPHLIVAKSIESDARSIADAETLVRHLAGTLGVRGNFAFSADRSELWIAVEREIDAERLRVVLAALPHGSSDEWNSMAFVQLDQNAMKRIAGLRGRKPTA